MTDNNTLPKTEFPATSRTTEEASTDDQPEAPVLYTEPTGLFRVVDFFSEEQIKAVVTKALSFRSRAPHNMRHSFNAAIDAEAVLDIRGFAHPSKAKLAQLVIPVFEACQRKIRLLGAVLRMWQASRATLHNHVAEHLKSLGLDAKGLNFKKGLFLSLWDQKELQEQCDAFEAQHPDEHYSYEDVALMFCLVSGGCPALPGELASLDIATVSALQFVDEIRSLPPDAPEWTDIWPLLEALEDLGRWHMQQQLVTLAARQREQVETLCKDYADELKYLECDLSPSFSAISKYPTPMWAALDHPTEKLRELLAQYRPLRPQGQSRAEEMQRAAKRADCEQQIIDTVDRWLEAVAEVIETSEALAEEEQALMDAEAADDAQALAKSTDKAAASDAGADADSLQEKYESAKSSRDRLKGNYRVLRARHRKLKQSQARLESKVKTLSAELDELRNAQQEQAPNQDDRNGLRTEESQGEWLVSYVPEHLKSVQDAIEQANRTFPTELHFALNSKSSVNSFGKPDEVFSALAWLATDYRNQRINPQSGDQLADMIRKACPGWFYKTKQAAATMHKYKDWYTTAVNGKRLQLHLHIGRGKSFDPKSTIRIAFAWNKATQQVVVGFIGMHQRDRRS